MSRLLQIYVRNFLGIKKADLKMKGAIEKIVGTNGSGKSSFLKAAAWAIGGADECPDLPIRKGTSEAEVMMELDDCTIHRVARDGKRTTIDVRSKPNGEKVSSPEAFLKSLVNGLSFDPFRFISMPESEQAEMLAGIAKIDLAKIEEEFDAAYKKRTDANRDLKKAEAQLAAMAPTPGGVPDEETSVGEVLERIKAATATNAAADGLVSKAREAEAEVGRIERTINGVIDEPNRLRDELKAEVEKITKSYEQKIENVMSHIKAYRENHDKAVAAKAVADRSASEASRVDLAPLQAKASEAEGVNRLVRLKKDRNEKEIAVENLASESKALDRMLDEIKDEKSTKLAAAKFPVSGISIDAGKVSIDGVPFKQCSKALQTRTSVGLALAMNSKLPLLLIDDGEHLDEDNEAILIEEIEKAKAQVILAVVKRRGEPVTGFEMISGELTESR